MRIGFETGSIRPVATGETDMKVQRSGDCGNSPKNVFAEEVTIAIAKRDTRFLRAKLTDDVRWNVVGARIVDGKQAFCDALAMQSDAVTKLVINHVVSHGRAAAVNGVAEDAEGGSIDFCNVYEFGNAKGNSLKSITAYAVRATVK